MLTIAIQTLTVSASGAGKIVQTGYETDINGTGTSLRAQWSAASLIKTATDTWTLIGDNWCQTH